MKLTMPRAAKRLIISLVVLSGTAGCVAYAPAPPGSYSYYDNNGETVYVTPQVVAPVYVEPRYVGPPVFFNFGYSSWSGPRYHGRRGHWGGSHRGYHRGHGGRGGRHR